MRIRKLLAKARPNKTKIREWLLVWAAATVVYGVAQWSHPAAFVVGGVAVAVWALLSDDGSAAR